MLYMMLGFIAIGCAFGQLDYRSRYFYQKNRFSNNYNDNYRLPRPNDQYHGRNYISKLSNEEQYYPKTHNYGRNLERNAVVLKSANNVNSDGGFHYSYQTSNGISTEAIGVPKYFGGHPSNTATVMRGSFSWTAPDGTPVSISYIADENGYRAVGDAIPTPPPIPEAILRSLEYIKKQGIKY